MVIGLEVVGVKLGRRRGCLVIGQLGTVCPGLFVQVRSKGQGRAVLDPAFTLGKLFKRVEPRVNLVLYQFSDHQISLGFQIIVAI